MERPAHGGRRACRWRRSPPGSSTGRTGRCRRLPTWPTTSPRAPPGPASRANAIVGSVYETGCGAGASEPAAAARLARSRSALIAERTRSHADDRPAPGRAARRAGAGWKMNTCVTRISTSSPRSNHRSASTRERRSRIAADHDQRAGHQRRDDRAPLGEAVDARCRRARTATALTTFSRGNEQEQPCRRRRRTNGSSVNSR